MSQQSYNDLSVGWVGMGRMGYPMAERLVEASCTVKVWNRTKAKAAPLAAKGAVLADKLVELADCDVVFSMVSTQDVLENVIFGDNGILSGESAPQAFVDCSSISVEVSADIRARLADHGIKFLVSPVSGNGKCVKAGKLAIVASGPQDTYTTMEPFLNIIGGMGVTYVGDGELARVVKICHNVFLAVVTQSLAEVTILAQKSGVARHAFLDFMNKSVMGSIFTRYKTPGWVNQDYAVTFTPELMRKDMDLGLSMGRKQEVPMPAAATTRDIIQSSMGHGNRGDVDFGIVLAYMAECSGLVLKPENIDVPSGLEVDDAS